MKYIKTYESINNEYQVGDYVIMSTDERNNMVKNFVDTNIGQIIEIYKRGPDNAVKIKYDKVPEELETFFVPYRTFSQNQIVHFAKTKKQIEMYITANKFNL